MLVFPKIQEPAGLNAFSVLYWNHVGLEMNRITHSLGGPQAGPTMSSRALGLLHLAMHDSYFAVLGHDQSAEPPTYLPDCERPVVLAGVGPDLANANEALTGAAVTMLGLLYGSPPASMSTLNRHAMAQHLSHLIAEYPPHIDALKASYRFGAEIAQAIYDRLAVKPGEIGADAGVYEPKQGRFFFHDEPVVPLRRVPIDPNDPSKGTRAQRSYHGPFYGQTVRSFAVTDDAGHSLDEWPQADYEPALRQVVELGGAPNRPGTKRTPDQTVAGLYWAYDGANLIGTPPRLYNQILRVVAWDMRDTSKGSDDQQTNSDFVRLFALANTAMADAGKFSWLEKYRFELWRPLSGVREHDDGESKTPAGNTNLQADADPFWTALGAPETNTNMLSFKPPFPAYPSGHATFGAACFQMARLFYKDRKCLDFDPGAADSIGFAFVSEELNGVSRDLHQPYDPSLPIEDQPGDIRTKVVRRFPSLWHAIFENAISRIFLGVHWRFDAAEAGDILQADGTIKGAADVTYSHVWTQKRQSGEQLPIGGVPLGLGIANDIWMHKMRAPGTAEAALAQPQPAGPPEAAEDETVTPPDASVK